MTSSDSVVIDLLPVATRVEIVSDGRRLPVSTEDKSAKKKKETPFNLNLKKLNYQNEIDNDYYITKICIYHASRTCIIMTMLTVVVIASLYIAQLFFLVDTLPDNLVNQARSQFLTSACNPQTDKSCRTDIRSCYIVNSINTCKGGETPP